MNTLSDQIIILEQLQIMTGFSNHRYITPSHDKSFRKNTLSQANVKNTKHVEGTGGSTI